MTDTLTPVIVFMFAVVMLCLPHFVLTARENRYLRGWLDDAQSSLSSCVEDLFKAHDMYVELAEKYHELSVAYFRAYEMLEENGIIPKDDE
jgi:hypothetical protein